MLKKKNGLLFTATRVVPKGLSQLSNAVSNYSPLTGGDAICSSLPVQISDRHACMSVCNIMYDQNVTMF